MQPKSDWLWLPLCVTLSLAPHLASAGEARVYVTDSGGDSIEVIDPATNKVAQVITGIGTPHGINFSPDGSRIYVSSESRNALEIVDRETGKITDEVALSGHPNNIAITKDGGRVVVAINAGRGALDVVDTVTKRLTKSIPVNGPLHNVYVTPDGKYAVAGSIPGQIMTVIDLQTEEPAWEVRFEAGVRPMAIEANPDGSTERIFVELSNFHGFAVVDFASRKEVSRVTLPDDPAAAGSEGEITPCHGIAVAPDGKTLWVNSILANAVFAYSLPDLRPLGYVLLPTRERPGEPALSARPNWISFTPDSKRLYVSNSTLDSVSVIDAAAIKQIAVIPVGKVPKRSNTLALQ